MSLFLCLLVFLGVLVLSEKPLNVHLVCHTHDDVGWLKNVDEYFAGTKKDIQDAKVHFILDSVIESLQKSPDRKFIYVEISFFKMWWDIQSDPIKEIVRNLVYNGQLEFINGGWCMNDEATTYYQSIIDQMTLGHEFLLNEFGVKPTIGWHIDPFGHSSTQASLFALMGFDAFMFGRIDYEDKILRMEEKNLEFVWRPSPSLGASNEIFTVVTYHGYNPPKGFCFDIHCNDDPIQGNPNLSDYDLDIRAADFASKIREQAANTKGSDIMLTMGSDFQYEYAEEWFKNLDLLIDFFALPEIKAIYNLNVFYSTPSVYLKSKLSEGNTWTTKTDDFFPYADRPHAYWTGYFTSRPDFKYYERSSNALYQSCRVLELARNIAGVSGTSSKAMAESMGIVQHHDAVSGTAKQAVNDDYTLRLFKGRAVCDQVRMEALNVILGTSEQFARCDYLNISICISSEDSSVKVLTFFNPTAHPQTRLFQVPVTDLSLSVNTSSHLMPIWSNTMRARTHVNISSDSNYRLVFPYTVQGFAISQILLSPSEVPHKVPEITGMPERMENSQYALEFMSGSMKVSNKVSGVSASLDISWMRYISSVGDEASDQASGAYIFRPVGPAEKLCSEDSSQFAKGEIVQELYQSCNDYSSHVIRLVEGLPFVEIEFTVGPINVSDGYGKEIVARFDSDLSSGDLFFTDGNGKEVVQRRRDYRPTWNFSSDESESSNYVPINSRIFIQDLQRDTQLTILNDRSQGGTSLESGQIEIMVHRRTVQDDHRGVGEPLSENIIVRGSFKVSVDTIERSQVFHRLESKRTAHPLEIYFSHDIHPEVSDLVLPFYMASLPDALEVLTLQDLGDQSVLIRIEHIFAVGESQEYSVPVTFDMSKVFGVDVQRELTLTGNQEVMENGSRNGNIVTISPMQIRTFQCSYATI